MKNDLYEIHLTFSVGGERKHALERYTEERGWKWSYIQNDPVLGKQNYCYATRYAASMDRARASIQGFVSECPEPAIRQKIEHIVFDTKAGDEFL